MTGTNITRRSFTNLSEPQQVRELNRQMEWIWHQLLGGLTEKAFSVKGVQQTVKRIEKTVATALDVDELEANQISASLANFLVAHISVAEIDMANINALQAAVGVFMDAYIHAADINWANIEHLTADIVEIMSAAIQNGDFDFAFIQQLVASAMILEQGVGGEVTIENLVATSAMFVQATMGGLCLKGQNGSYYNVTITSDGDITTEEVTVSDQEIAAAQTESGRKIIETTALIDDLNATNLRAQGAIIADIFTDALNAHQINASQAMLASATIPELYVTAINALGSTLSINAGQVVVTLEGQPEETLESKLLALSDRLSFVTDHVETDVDGAIKHINTYFTLDGSDPNAPKMIIGTTGSKMKMELSNSQLSFKYNDAVVAYFNEEMLYVKAVNVTDKFRITASSGGYLDLVPTDTGIAFVWRTT